MSNIKWVFVTSDEFSYKTLLENLSLSKDECRRLVDYSTVEGICTDVPVVVFGTRFDHPGKYAQLATALRQAEMRGHPIYTLARYR